MRKLIFIALIAIGYSCSSDDSSDCLSEKQKESDRFDELIQKAEGDDAQQRVLIRNKEIALSQFDC